MLLPRSKEVQEKLKTSSTPCPLKIKVQCYVLSKRREPLTTIPESDENFTFSFENRGPADTTVLLTNFITTFRQYQLPVLECVIKEVENKSSDIIFDAFKNV